MSKIFTQNFLSKVFSKALVFGLLLLPMVASSQFYNGYQMDFGRSRVQFDNFLWTYYRFNRFDTYFYLNGKELAIHTAKYAELELLKYEDELDTYLEGNIQFIIFNNLNDLKQSNIGLTAETEYNIGGISYILGNKVILYFDGSMVNFERQIRHGIAHVLLQNAIFGNNIGSQVMNSFLSNFPEWYTLGLIAYLAEDWDTEIDNRIRNAIQSGKYKKFNRMVMDENLVKDAGYSFWRFIAEKYGKSNIVSIINMTRVSRSIETGFQYVLGLTLDRLYEEWLSYYTTESETAQLNRFLPPDDKIIAGKRVLKRNSRDRVYSEFQVSPDGKYAAFVTNETGKYKVWLMDMNSGKLKKIYTEGYKLDEKIDYSYPILTWHPSGRFLTMVLEKKGLIWLSFYNVEDREFTDQNIFGFDKVLDISYSDDGRKLLFSGVQQGKNDIFLFTISSGSYERVTNDIWDDLNPQFLENSNKIIFSSNRQSDTLEWDEPTEPGTIGKYYDLFIYDYAAKDPILRRVTNTPVASEKQPQPYMDGYFSFLSDENGIYNEYLGMLDSAVAFVDTTVHYRYFTRSFAVTNYQKNIKELHVSPTTGYKTWIVNDKLYDKLYIDIMMLPEMMVPGNLNNTTYMNQLLAGLLLKDVQIPESNSPGLPKEEFEISGQTGQRKSFKNVMRNSASRSNSFSKQTENSGTIDIDNYKISKQKPDNYKAAANDDVESAIEDNNDEDSFVIPKQRIYNTQYSINELVTRFFDFSYLNQSYQSLPVSSGWSPTIGAGITDLMENYRIFGGARIGMDLVNKEFFFSYANLKDRLDKEFVFQRRTNEASFSLIPQLILREKTNECFVILTYPLSRVLRLQGTFSLKNENFIIAGPSEIALRVPNESDNWAGAKIKLIYDDTKVLGLNLFEGTRFMVFGEYSQLLSLAEENLMVVGFDFRNYTRIHRQFIWANRIAASTNFGSNKVLYFMGGTDSWMFPSIDQDTRIDPDQNWRYFVSATNMRGFNQNARNGNSFIVINSEFRLPVFRYFINKPIKSQFIKNFQVLAFGDLGTAWSGWNPYDEDNVLYTRYQQSGPLSIKVQYEKDPLIGGIGFGARTKLLGYFIKGDLAWGIEDGKIKKNPIFYLSMSLDF